MQTAEEHARNIVPPEQQLSNPKAQWSLTGQQGPHAHHHRRVLDHGWRGPLATAIAEGSIHDGRQCAAELVNGYAA